MLRFILAEILSGVPSSFETIQHIVPEMGLQVQAYPIVPGGGRMVKTHEPYRREYKRGIYIIRDVRDVMLSCLARETAMGVIRTNLDDYVRPFMQGKMQHFGSWQAHVDSWLNSPIAKSGDLLVMRFEDMRKDLEGSVARSLEFLGKSVDPSVIQTAVRNNSTESMRAKEDRAKKLPKSPGPEGRQIGKGAIEGWRQKMTKPQLEIVEEFAGDTLARLHYPSGVSGNGSEERNRPKETGPLRSEFPNARHQPVGAIAAGNLPQVSTELQAGNDPTANRDLRIRIGGRIARSFCWYRY